MTDLNQGPVTQLYVKGSFTIRGARSAQQCTSRTRATAAPVRATTSACGTPAHKVAQMKIVTATSPGHVGRPNEDFVGDVPGAVVLLDGAGIPGTETICRHGVA
jgi:hypothetical protein